MPRRRFKLKAFEPKEYDVQATLFSWATMEMQKHRPELQLMFATLNGMRLSIGAAVKAKKAGMRAGAPDVVLPVVRSPYHGLFVEMKRRSGKLQDHQSVWLDKLREQGYLAVACYSFDEARETIENYLDGVI